MFSRTLKKEEFIIDKRAKLYTLLLTIIFFSFYTISIIYIQDVDYFPLLLATVTLITFGLVIWVFFTAYRGRILPEINSRVIAIGFILLLVSNIIVSPLIIIFGQIPVVVLTLESGTLFSTIVILIGLKTRAKYQNISVKGMSD